MLGKLYKSFLIWLLMDIKNIVLGVAIIILTIFVVVYGINTFYTKPQYEDFCDEFKSRGVINNQEDCEQTGGKWDGAIVLKPDQIPEGYCDTDFICREEYNNAREIYSKLFSEEMEENEEGTEEDKKWLR